MNKFETIKETGSNNEKMSIGQIIDNLLENPAIMIKQFSKMLEDCKKANEELQIQLKNKQSEIDYLKGQLSVYQKMLDEDRNHTTRID